MAQNQIHTMKKILFFYSLFVSTILSAQAPQGINYQAVYRNAAGLVKSENIVVECRVRQGSATGTTLYSETHNTKTNEAGLFTVVIGEGTDPTGIFKNIDWGNGDKYCDIKIGGALIGNFQFQSVPYALYAEKAKLDLPIAIFEERRPNGQKTSNPAVQGWNKRSLSYTDPMSSNIAVLDGNNIKFNQTGKYLITASAPAYQTLRHKLVLRNQTTNLVVLNGSSKFSNAPDDVDNNSEIKGILNVTNLNDRYYLDHYISFVKTASNGMGIETIIPGTTLEEIYAQIMIQKIN